MRPTLEMIQRTYWWPNMYKQVQSLVEKCDLCQRYAKQVKSLKDWRENPLPQRPWSSISVDFLEMRAAQVHRVLELIILRLGNRYDMCRFNLIILLSKTN